MLRLDRLVTYLSVPPIAQLPHFGTEGGIRTQMSHARRVLSAVRHPVAPLRLELVDPGRLERPIICVSGRYVDQLHHGSIQHLAYCL